MQRVAEGRTIIARIGNVVRVNFSREPEPPAPRFPGAGALRGGIGEEETREPICAVAASSAAAARTRQFN